MLIGRIKTSNERTLRILRVGRRKDDGGSGTEWRCSCELESTLGVQGTQRLSLQKLKTYLGWTPPPATPCRHLKNLYQGDLQIRNVQLTEAGYEVLERRSTNPGQQHFLKRYRRKLLRQRRARARRRYDQTAA